MNEKASVIVRLAQEHLGAPYVYGAWGSPCTPELRRRYARLNPSHATAIAKKCQVLNGSGTSCAGCKWQGALAYDCRGFTRWLLARVGIEIAGSGATSQYNSVSNWAERGKIADMPDVVCCLFRQSGSKMEHTGMHIGGGRVIHCSAGVQTGSIGQGWTHYAVPVGLYSADEIEKAGRIKVRKTLRKGASGDEVRELQAMLAALGYDVGTVDGAFGSATESAVRAFQTTKGLTVDGICGTATWAALDAAEKQPDGDMPPKEPDAWRAKLEALRDNLRSALEVLEEVLNNAVG